MQQYKRWVIYTASLFLVISAILINGQHMYFMAALLLMLPVVSYLFGMYSLRGLEFTREIPHSGWDGETVEFAFSVKSTLPVPRLVLEIRDELPEWITPENRRPVLFHAPPNRTTRVSYRVQLGKRGLYKLGGFTVTALDPLGIYAFSRRFMSDTEMIVYPVPEEIPELALSGAERFGVRELPVAAVRGSGVDPDGVREYVPGDPLRRMHWKLTARTGRLSVIEFEESRAVRVVIALDTSIQVQAGHGPQSVFEYLVRIAASISQQAIRHGSAVRLVASEPDEASITDRGADHLYTILSSLARAEPESHRPLGESLIENVGMLPAGNSLIALTGGNDPTLPAALSQYASEGVQVAVVYADSSSFAQEKESDEQLEYLNSLCASQASVYKIARRDDRLIAPEKVCDYGYGSRS